jgi:hypothetical protein
MGDVTQGAMTDRLADYRDLDVVPDSVTRAIFGGVTRQTVYRWERDLALGFPAARKIRGHKYRLAGELKEYRMRQFGF